MEAMQELLPPQGPPVKHIFHTCGSFGEVGVGAALQMNRWPLSASRRKNRRMFTPTLYTTLLKLDGPPKVQNGHAVAEKNATVTITRTAYDCLLEKPPLAVNRSDCAWRLCVDVVRRGRRHLSHPKHHTGVSAFRR